jgi:hypothetical protein
VQALTECDRFQQAKAAMSLMTAIVDQAAARGESRLVEQDVPEITYSVVVGSGDDNERALLKKTNLRIIQQEWVLPEMGTQPPCDTPETPPQQPDPPFTRKPNRNSHRRRRA